MQDRTHNGAIFRILNVIDEYSRECFIIKMARRLTLKDILDVFLDLFLERNVQVHIRSDIGSEFKPRRCVSNYSGCLSDLYLSSLEIHRGLATSNASMTG